MQRQKELPTQKTQVDQQTKEKTRDKKLSKSGSRESNIIQSNLHKIKKKREDKSPPKFYKEAQKCNKD